MIHNYCYSNVMEKAIFAAGCFWGVQYYFDQVPGVVKTTVGYTGGTTKNPTYEQVCSHLTGHAEAVLIEFDQTKISYDLLLKHFFRMHDPTQLNRQGPDIGDNYRSEIFYFSEVQSKAAHLILDQVQHRSRKPVVTLIEPAADFYVAESYHQKYAQRTGRGICHISYESLT